MCFFSSCASSSSHYWYICCCVCVFWCVCLPVRVYIYICICVCVFCTCKSKCVSFHRRLCAFLYVSTVDIHFISLFSHSLICHRFSFIACTSPTYALIWEKFVERNRLGFHVAQWQLPTLDFERFFAPVHGKVEDLRFKWIEFRVEIFAFRQCD